MQEISSIFLSECQALARLCEHLTPDQWQLHTDFHGWTPWDEIAHLAYFDETGLKAATDPQCFIAQRKLLMAELKTGREISAIARSRFGHLEGPALLERWCLCHEALSRQLRGLDSKARLPWYGPDMSARSFATARLMETWAHGQDIWDALELPRAVSPGLRNIAHLGVTTYGWTFVNRGMSVVLPQPFVSLEAPDGTTWSWGEASDRDYVRGPALDFALLVTQRRHRDDTQLAWAGTGAELWTRSAQCFAGPPADGPAPGTRVRRN